MTHVSASQKRAQLLEMAPVTCPGQHLHQDRVSDGDLGLKQPIDLVAGGGAGAPEKFDPGRTVDQDHDGPDRDSRMPARSPSHPEPFSWRAFSTLVSAASWRTAKLTTTRLLDNSNRRMTSAHDCSSRSMLVRAIHIRCTNRFRSAPGALPGGWQPPAGTSIGPRHRSAWKLKYASRSRRALRLTHTPGAPAAGCRPCLADWTCDHVQVRCLVVLRDSSRRAPIGGSELAVDRGGLCGYLPTVSGPAAARWAGALESWAIPERILAQAPEPPWVLPPELFQVDASALTEDTPSRRAARSGLSQGGTVLDVGCGGGAASLPLAALATRITGVDQSPAMLASFAAASRASNVGHLEVEGSWPDVADKVEPADLVVCHHVVYNVAQIRPFLAALTQHARRLVVIELTDSHPTSPFNSLWERFWSLSRPQQPSARLFLEVVGELGYDPVAESWVRRPQAPKVARADYVAFARRRLCLPVQRDPEVDAALGDSWPLVVPKIMTVAWAPPQ